MHIIQYKSQINKILYYIGYALYQINSTKKAFKDVY